MGRTSQSLGAAGEQQAISALHRVGVNMVEHVGTPVKLIPVNSEMTRRGVYRVVFGERVAADHRGVARGGISVLAEVKTCFGRNLQWSDLEQHQIESLTEHDQLGGISLIVYVTDNGIHVMRWPVVGFGHGKGINPEKAEDLAINDEQELLVGKVKTYL